MAQYKQTEVNVLDVEQGNQDVVDIAKYKQPEASAFEQVMSQMNIAGRSAFDKQYAQLWNEASESNELLSVFMCEIDLFKAYYDNYGEQGASFMLLVVALALKNTCEKYGCFLAHYQKEEFGILMKGGDEKQALEVAESLRQAVESSRTEHKFSNVSKFVTLSIGVSSIYPNSLAVLMQKVDGALHQAKVLGKNQVYGDFPQKSEQVTTQETAISEENHQQEKLLDDIDDSYFKQFMQDMNIADRDAFNCNFTDLWQECKSEEELLSMLICEVDFFYPFRENCGKQASQDILLITACSLQQTCEKFGGFVYHFGEEKFIVLLKGGNATNALRVAEFLHQFLAESNTENKYSEVSDVLTVSVGLSSLFPSDSNSMRMLTDEANKALKASIKSGRNQTSVH